MVVGACFSRHSRLFGSYRLSAVTVAPSESMLDFYTSDPKPSKTDTFDDTIAFDNKCVDTAMSAVFDRLAHQALAEPRAKLFKNLGYRAYAAALREASSAIGRCPTL